MRRLFSLALLLACTVTASAGTGRIIIRNLDAKGVGFDDPTPVEPIGGNPGTTLGAQRLFVFQEAARRWQNSLDTNVDIVVAATFAPIGDCSASEAVLGAAGPMYYKHSFLGAPQGNVWYPAALANKLAGVDLDNRDDITATFNADVDEPECLSVADSDWYYGLDGNHGSDIDLFVVVLHEIGHGLGFVGRGSDFADNRPSVFETHMFDASLGLRWDQMTLEQRRASVTNTGNVLWDGPNVRENISRYLTPVTTLTVTEPATIARNYDIGFAAFGANAKTSALSGKVVLAVDAANFEGPTVNDGCTPFTNAGAIAGNIALVDRGTPPEPAPSCTFAKKALNAQNAGAIGVIIADNRRETCMPPAMAGTTDAVRIPVVSITQDVGDALKAQLSANTQVNTMLRVDPSQLAGASQEGYIRLYSPCTQEPGSSTYHWDVVASPNLLMEPNVNSDLQHGLDLTMSQLLDIGWTLPARSGRRILKR
jgi:hypothetical protein